MNESFVFGLDEFGSQALRPIWEPSVASNCFCCEYNLVSKKTNKGLSPPTSAASCMQPVCAAVPLAMHSLRLLLRSVHREEKHPIMGRYGPFRTSSSSSRLAPLCSCWCL